jgi:hypothetical protein
MMHLSIANSAPFWKNRIRTNNNRRFSRNRNWMCGFFAIFCSFPEISSRKSENFTFLLCPNGMKSPCRTSTMSGPSRCSMVIKLPGRSSFSSENRFLTESFLSLKSILYKPKSWLRQDHERRLTTLDDKRSRLYFYVTT